MTDITQETKEVPSIYIKPLGCFTLCSPVQ